MARLFNFDYKTPFFYMVTLKRLPGLADFSRIAEDGRLVRNAITIAFERIICTFHEKWRCIDPISPFIVMPDHIHLMIKIKPTADRVALGVIVSQMSKALRTDIRILTPPLGVKEQSSPVKKNVIAGAFLLGLFLPAAAIFIRERKRRES